MKDKEKDKRKESKNKNSGKNFSKNKCLEMNKIIKNTDK